MEIKDEKDLEDTSSEDASASEESEEAEEEAEAEDSDSEADEDEVETDESGEDSETDGSIDFEDRLKKEKDRLGKKVDKERGKRIEERKKFIPREEAEKLVDEKVAQAERRMMRGQAEQLAGQRAKSQSEKDLILFHYDNTIVPSGNIETDIENAHAIANKKQVKGTISELKKTIEHKKTLGGGSDAGALIEQKPPKKYSKDIIEGAKFAGVSPEEFAKKLSEKEK